MAMSQSQLLLISPRHCIGPRGSEYKADRLPLMKIFNNNALAWPVGWRPLCAPESDVTGLRDNQRVQFRRRGPCICALPINLGQFIIPSDAQQIYGRGTFDGKTAANE